MSRLELQNYDFVDDRVANELRLEEPSAGSTVFSISDGSDELQVDSLSTVDATNLSIGSPVDFQGALTLNNNDLDLGGGALNNPSEIQFDDNSDDGSNWRMLEDGSSSYLNISIGGTEHFKLSDGGPVELPNHDLRLSTGQAIEDGSGTERLFLKNSYTSINSDTGAEILRVSDDLVDLSQSEVDLKFNDSQNIVDEDGTPRIDININSTYINDENGDVRFKASEIGNAEIFADSNTDVHIYDSQFSDIAVNYTSSSSAPGTLELTNAEIDHNGGNITNFNDLVHGDSNGALQIRDPTDGTLIDYKKPQSAVSTRLDISGQSADLRLATGQSIEDGSGNRRFLIEGGQTILYDNDDNTAYRADAGNRVGPDARNGQPWQIRDQYGGFDAVTYKPSASAPGTLELTNANLDANSNNITGVNALEAKEITRDVNVTKGSTTRIEKSIGTISIHSTSKFYQETENVGTSGKTVITIAPNSSNPSGLYATAHVVGFNQYNDSFYDKVQFGYNPDGTNLIGSHSRGADSRFYQSGADDPSLTLTMDNTSYSDVVVLAEGVGLS